MQPPKTQYARNGDVNIAYQVVGDGPIDLAIVPGFISHVDLWWTIPETTAFIRRLATFSRLILFDKRGTGLSDPVAGTSSLEERMEDLHAVLDAAGSERCALLGVSEGGPMSVLCSATYPDRIAALALYGTYPTANPDRYPPELVERTEGKFAELTAIVDQHWGEGLAIEWFAPNLAGSPTMRRSWGLFERAAASPGMVGELLRSYREIDVTEVLPTLRVPTLVLHRTDDSAVAVEAGRMLAELIPGARYVELPGNDHIPWFGDADALLDEIEEFLTATVTRPSPIGPWRRFSSPTSRGRPSAPQRSATAAGASCWSATRRSCAIGWPPTGGARSKRWAMAFWLRSTGPPRRFGARARSPSARLRRESKFGRACTPVSAS